MVLLSVAEGIMGAVFSIGSLFLMFMGFAWISQKFFGTRIHGKYQAGEAYRLSMFEQQEVEKYNLTNPKIVQEAIDNCKKKGYSNTYSNVLSEIRKIEKNK